MNKFMEYFKYVIPIGFLLGVPIGIYIVDYDYINQPNEPVIIHNLNQENLSANTDKYVKIKGHCFGLSYWVQNKNNTTDYSVIEKCDAAYKDPVYVVVKKSRSSGPLDELFNESLDMFSGRLVQGLHIDAEIEDKMRAAENIKDDRIWTLKGGETPESVKNHDLFFWIMFGIGGLVLLLLFGSLDLKKYRRFKNAVAVILIHNVLQDPNPDIVQLQVKMKRGNPVRGDEVYITKKTQTPIIKVATDADGFTRLSIEKRKGIKWKSLKKKPLAIMQDIE